MSTITSVAQVHPDRDYVLYKEIKRYVSVQHDGSSIEIPVDEAQETPGGLLVVRGSGQNFGHVGGAIQGSEVRVSQRNPHFLILRVGPEAAKRGFAPGQVWMHDAHYNRNCCVLVNGEEHALEPCDAFVARFDYPPELQPSITEDPLEN